MRHKTLSYWSFALLNMMIVFAGNFCMAQQTSKVALVIGNSSYKSFPLRNPEHDAKDFAKSLKDLGYNVIEHTNIKTGEIDSMLRDFRAKLVPGGVAIVFYAGHCVNVKNENYLPAVDADVATEEDIPLYSLALTRLMNVLVEADTRANLVFLDACTFGQKTVPPRTMISFAASPGAAVLDGDGRNGLYTGSLLEQIRKSDQPITSILEKVASDVRLVSNGVQEPWAQGKVDEGFCMKECAVSSERNNSNN